MSKSGTVYLDTLSIAGIWLSLAGMVMFSDDPGIVTAMAVSGWFNSYMIAARHSEANEPGEGAKP